ncbi:MAG: hypothetical protein ACLUE1_01975 [Adlercreutzia equolifaciens]
MVAVGGPTLSTQASRSCSAGIRSCLRRLLVGVVLFALLKLIKLDSYVDQRVVSRIGSCATDYLVAFGVATININVVLQYWAIILVLCLLGFVLVAVYFFYISRHLFSDHWVERGIFIWGWSTGVMSIAVLLRVVDPEFRTRHWKIPDSPGSSYR